jgi:hypothetical protein
MSCWQKKRKCTYNFFYNSAKSGTKQAGDISRCNGEGILNNTFAFLHTALYFFLCATYVSMCLCGLKI